MIALALLASLGTTVVSCERFASAVSEVEQFMQARPDAAVRDYIVEQGDTIALNRAYNYILAGGDYASAESMCGA